MNDKKLWGEIWYMTFLKTYISLLVFTHQGIKYLECQTTLTTVNTFNSLFSHWHFIMFTILLFYMKLLFRSFRWDSSLKNDPSIFSRFSIDSLSLSVPVTFTLLTRLSHFWNRAPLCVSSYMDLEHYSFLIYNYLNLSICSWSCVSLKFLDSFYNYTLISTRWCHQQLVWSGS